MRTLPVCFPTVAAHSREVLHFVGVSRRRAQTKQRPFDVAKDQKGTSKPENVFNVCGEELYC